MAMSHSLTNSERLLDQFKENGITHICNNFIPYSSKIVIKPYKIWDDLSLRMPDQGYLADVLDKMLRIVVRKVAMSFGAKYF